MKKFLSDISENEKNRILSLHENYKEILKNKILTEQLDMPKIQGSANDEPENALCKTNYCKTVNGTAQCTDGMLKDFELLSKYIDNTRDAADAYVIATTMATSTKPGLGDDSRAKELGRLQSQIIAEQVKSLGYYRLMNRACRFENDRDACCALTNLSSDLKVQVENAKSVGETVSLIITKAEQTAKSTQGGTDLIKVYRPEIPFNQIFDNNSSVVKEEFKNQIKNYLTPIIQQLGEGHPINTISVDTSSSRFRNTGEAADLTFKQLSEQRAEAAKNNLVEIAKSLGFNTQNIKFNLNPNGGNGDGTSGPNPPDPTPYVDGGEVKMNTAPTKPRNEFGEPLANAAEYEKFKYCNVSFGIPPKNVITPESPGNWDVEFFYYQPMKRQGSTEPMFLKNKIKKYLKGLIR